MALLTYAEQARIEGVVSEFWRSRSKASGDGERVIGYRELVIFAEMVWREAVSASQRDDPRNRP